MERSSADSVRLCNVFFMLGRDHRGKGECSMLALAFVALLVGSVVTIIGAMFSSWSLVIAAPFAASIATLVTGGFLASSRQSSVSAETGKESAMMLDALSDELAAKLRHAAARMGEAEEASRIKQCRVDSSSKSGERKVV